MLWVAVVCLSILHFNCVEAEGECTDLHGRLVTSGLHYIPGPDTCTLCICDNGQPRVCKAVLCSPPQDCRSFRVGSTCCEFICLDDVVKPAETHEANFRLVGGGVGGIVLITIAFSVYRVRKQKRRQPPHIDDRGSLTSIGYISGSMGCMGGACEPGPGAWKPPGHYLPRGEAPPPYEEAMAQCRSDQIRFSESLIRPAYPNNLDAIARPEDSIQCVGHGYVNLTRPVAQIPNTQSCFTAPLLQPVHNPENRENNIIPHHPIPPPIGRGLFRLTGSLGTISNRALSVARDEHERPHNVPGFYTTHTALHRTIPRISTATDTSALDATCFSRSERACGEVRRSFHRPEPPRDRPDRIERQHHAHPRSVPRNLNIASVTDADSNLDGEMIVKSSGGRSRAHSEEQVVSERGKVKQAQPHVPIAAAQPQIPQSQAPLPQSVQQTQFPGPVLPSETLPSSLPPQSTLPLTVDKPSCGCSYSGNGDRAAEVRDCAPGGDGRTGRLPQRVRELQEYGGRQLGGGLGLVGLRYADPAATRAATSSTTAAHSHLTAAGYQTRAKSNWSAV
ncbi:unnamed protein product [Leptosia nina]|uniref:VWFC domain-containing protein n=1 Tax=Leptosia nina TaxID=320188 RepID=A0AAV1J2P5_9NEOP